MTDTDSLLGEMRRRMSEEKITSCMVIRQGISIFTYDKSKRLAGKLYKINSCTKSVLSAVVGVALDQGLIPSVQTPIAEYFPSLTSASDARKRAITIEVSLIALFFQVVQPAARRDHPVGKMAGAGASAAAIFRRADHAAFPLPPVQIDVATNETCRSVRIPCDA